MVFIHLIPFFKFHYSHNTMYKMVNNLGFTKWFCGAFFHPRKTRYLCIQWFLMNSVITLKIHTCGYGSYNVYVEFFTSDSNILLAAFITSAFHSANLCTWQSEHMHTHTHARTHAHTHTHEASHYTAYKFLIEQSVNVLDTVWIITVWI